MFLFAKLVLNNLAKQPNLALFRNEIASARLPNEIDQAYVYEIITNASGVLTECQIFPDNGTSRARSRCGTVQIHAIVARVVSLLQKAAEMDGGSISIISGN